MTYKKLTHKFILILVSLFILILVPIISYDPLHLYHKSWFSSEDRLHGNMRLQAAGIINNYMFDSIIVGTSMLKGTSSKYASSKLGGKFVNISADGSNLYERNLLMEHALRTKKINHIIYSFDMGLDANLKKNNRTLPLNKFNYLYDNNRFNDFYAYWNNKFIKCTLTFSTSTECIGRKRGLIRSDKWFDSIYTRNKNISGLNKWISKKGRGKNIYARIKKHIAKPFTQKQYEEKLLLTYKIIDKQLLRTIKQYKKTDFHIVLPPYSRFFYALWLKYNPLKYKLYTETIKYLVEESNKYKNMHVYLLDDMEYINDLGNYRDMRHYNTDMNNIIIDTIYEKKDIKSMNTLEILLADIKKKNQAYTDCIDDKINKILDTYKFRSHIEKKYKENILTLSGWALSYKITSVDLYRNGKKIKSMKLKKEKEVFNKYPAYNQVKSAFLFKHVTMESENDKFRLWFKNKNRVIKKMTIEIKED